MNILPDDPTTLETVNRFMNYGAVFLSFVVAGASFLALRSGQKLDALAALKLKGIENDNLVLKTTLGEVNLKVEQEARRRAQAETALIEAQLKLQQRVDWRLIDRNKFASAIASVPHADVEIYFEQADNESFNLAYQITDELLEAGWNVTKREPNAERIPIGLVNAGFKSTGRSPKKNEKRPAPIASENFPKDHTVILITVSSELEMSSGSPADGLKKVLTSCGIEATTIVPPYENMKPSTGTVRIVIPARL